MKETIKNFGTILEVNPGERHIAANRYKTFLSNIKKFNRSGVILKETKIDNGMKTEIFDRNGVLVKDVYCLYDRVCWTVGYTNYKVA